MIRIPPIPDTRTEWMDQCKGHSKNPISKPSKWMDPWIVQFKLMSHKYFWNIALNKWLTGLTWSGLSPIWNFNIHLPDYWRRWRRILYATEAGITFHLGSQWWEHTHGAHTLLQPCDLVGLLSVTWGGLPFWSKDEYREFCVNCSESPRASIYWLLLSSNSEKSLNITGFRLSGKLSEQIQHKWQNSFPLSERSFPTYAWDAIVQEEEYTCMQLWLGSVHHFLPKSFNEDLHSNVNVVDSGWKTHVFRLRKARSPTAQCHFRSLNVFLLLLFPRGPWG
jgi:hypothetical protein